MNLRNDGRECSALTLNALIRNMPEMLPEVIKFPDLADLAGPVRAGWGSVDFQRVIKQSAYVVMRLTYYSVRRKKDGIL